MRKAEIFDPTTGAFHIERTNSPDPLPRERLTADVVMTAPLLAGLDGVVTSTHRAAGEPLTLAALEEAATRLAHLGIAPIVVAGVGKGYQADLSSGLFDTAIAHDQEILRVRCSFAPWVPEYGAGVELEGMKPLSEAVRREARRRRQTRVYLLIVRWPA